MDRAVIDGLWRCEDYGLDCCMPTQLFVRALVHPGIDDIERLRLQQTSDRTSADLTPATPITSLSTYHLLIVQLKRCPLLDLSQKSLLADVESLHLEIHAGTNHVILIRFSASTQPQYQRAQSIRNQRTFQGKARLRLVLFYYDYRAAS